MKLQFSETNKNSRHRNASHFSVPAVFGRIGYHLSLIHIWLDTASVRMPSHPVALAVIRAAGVPLAAPSANLSGSPSPTTAADVLADMEGKIPLILDGGACSVGVESTVISLAGAQPVLLRPGYITKEQLEDAMGCAVALSDAVLHKLKDGESAASPGMKYKHLSLIHI